MEYFQLLPALLRFYYKSETSLDDLGGLLYSNHGHRERMVFSESLFSVGPKKIKEENPR